MTYMSNARLEMCICGGWWFIYETTFGEKVESAGGHNHFC